MKNNYTREHNHKMNPFLKKMTPANRPLISESDTQLIFESLSDNETKTISKENLYQYLVYFFEGISAIPNFQSMPSTADQIASATSITCFEDLAFADTDNISYSQFSNWYKK